MTPEGDVLKYKKYCVINECKKLASFNYNNEKEFLCCNDHKLDKIINKYKIEGDIFYVKNIIFLIQNFVKNTKRWIVYYVIKLLI